MAIFAKKVNDTEITDFINQEKENHAIQTMCDVLDIPGSTYYESLDKTLFNLDQENQRLTKRIIELHDDRDKRYGASKIHYFLNKEGYQVSVNRVQRLMKKAGIKTVIVKRFRPTPSKEKIVERENLLERDFTTNTVNEKWVGDITYIHTVRHGWCYLASVIDLHTKKIVGHSFGRKMTTELVTQALDNAYHTQQPNEGLIFSIPILAHNTRAMISQT